MAKQTPSVGHSDNGCGPPCKGSFYQERRLNIEKIGVGGHMVILRHPCCNCNTGCRRVALYHPRPAGIELLDDWTVKAIARVRWGDGCGGPEVEVDWKHGVILDLAGCYDEVSFEIVEILGSAPDEDVPYVVGVLSSCCGAGAARGCATRTTEQFTAETFDPMTGDGTVMIPIPPFAYAVSFAPIQVDSADFFSATTSLYQSGSGAVSNLTQVQGDTLPDPWMLMGGAETIVVAQTADTPVQFEAVFLIGV